MNEIDQEWLSNFPEEVRHSVESCYNECEEDFTHVILITGMITKAKGYVDPIDTACSIVSAFCSKNPKALPWYHLLYTKVTLPFMVMYHRQYQVTKELKSPDNEYEFKETMAIARNVIHELIDHIQEIPDATAFDLAMMSTKPYADYEFQETLVRKLVYPMFKLAKKQAELYGNTPTKDDA